MFLFKEKKNTLRQKIINEISYFLGLALRVCRFSYDHLHFLLQVSSNLFKHNETLYRKT